MYYAVLNKDIILIKVLIQSGVDVNFRGIEGYTPLLLAFEQGFLPGIEFLLTSGADRYLIRNDGQGIFDLLSNEDALALLTEENWHQDDSNIDGSDIDSVNSYGFFGGSASSKMN